MVGDNVVAVDALIDNGGRGGKFIGGGGDPEGGGKSIGLCIECTECVDSLEWCWLRLDLWGDKDGGDRWRDEKWDPDPGVVEPLYLSMLISL